jgi:hypothetical protein
MRVTILELLEELESFGLMSTKKEEAGQSAITNENDPEFRKLIDDWSVGMYDESPGTLLNEIENLLS